MAFIFASKSYRVQKVKRAYQTGFHGEFTPNLQPRLSPNLSSDTLASALASVKSCPKKVATVPSSARRLDRQRFDAACQGFGCVSFLTAPSDGKDMKEMTWFTFLISALATYRLSLMLSSEEGPLALFARLRRKVPPKSNPGRGIRCFLCWSVWISALATLYLIWLEVIPKAIAPVYWLALSGGAAIVHSLLRSD
jgi:hypothetical protein